MHYFFIITTITIIIIIQFWIFNKTIQKIRDFFSIFPSSIKDYKLVKEEVIEKIKNANIDELKEMIPNSGLNLNDYLLKPNNIIHKDKEKEKENKLINLESRVQEEQTLIELRHRTQNKTSNHLFADYIVDNCFNCVKDFAEINKTIFELRLQDDTTARVLLYSGAYTNVLENLNFLEGCDIEVLGNNPTTIFTNREGIAQKIHGGKWMLILKPSFNIS